MNNDDIEALLNSVLHKDSAKYTVTYRFKKDIINFFKEDGKTLSLFELGCSQGMSTKIYGNIFKEVLAVDIDSFNIEQAKINCKELQNVSIKYFDAYNSDWNELKYYDIVVIDAGHTYDLARQDVENVYNYIKPKYIIMDDYGNPNQELDILIDNMISMEELEFVQWIGEGEGYKTAAGWTMNKIEGVIFKLK